MDTGQGRLSFRENVFFFFFNYFLRTSYHEIDYTISWQNRNEYSSIRGSMMPLNIIPVRKQQVAVRQVATGM